jgi:hypothetical protein
MSSNGIKIALAIASFVLLIMSLLGILTAYQKPAEKTTNEQVTVLDYQQQGKFDYTAYLKPSHLYGPNPPETPPPPPDLVKYPIGIIDRFNMTFHYNFASDKPENLTYEGVEVRMVVKNPDAKETREINVFPWTQETGEFTVSFPLIFSDNYTEGYINLSDNLSGNEITITAYVYTTTTTDTQPLFESFTQSFTMHARGPMVEVDGDLYHTSQGYLGELNYEQQGQFDYEILIKPGTAFGDITLKPPATVTPAPVPPIAIGPQKQIILKLIDSMEGSFSYHLETSKTVGNVEETVSVQAVLENPNKWSKTLDLIPETTKNGDFTLNFPIDLNQYTELFDTIQKETGSPGSARMITINAQVHTSADTDYGRIEEDFIQSINTDLAGDTLAWTENLTKVVPGSIKTNRVIKQTQQYLGMPVTSARIMFCVFAGIFFVLFFLSLFWYLRTRESGFILRVRKNQQVQGKYKNIVVEAQELPLVKPGDTIILVSSLEDLNRTAESLLKPMIHTVKGHRQIYYVIDGTTRYEYHQT